MILHFYEAPGKVRFVETERRLEVAGPVGEGTGEVGV